MLSFIYDGSKLTAVTSDYAPHGINRNDFANIDDAQRIANDATTLTGVVYIPTDAGAHVSPRYDVIEAPRVGEEVSRAFNGDYYPAGKIVKVSASMRRVETVQGIVFYRRGNSAQWLNNGTWTMVSGVVDKRNHSF